MTDELDDDLDDLDDDLVDAKEYRVVIVGVGGVGIRLAKDVGRILEHQAPYSALLLVDGDHYELKNKNRQEFQTLGNKAEVLAKELDAEFPDTFVSPYAAWVIADDAKLGEESDEENDNAEISDEDTVDVELSEEQIIKADAEVEAKQEKTNRIRASDLIEEWDIIFPVVDNFSARKAILDAAMKLDNVDVILGGNDDALFGSIYHYRRRDGEEVTLDPTVFHPELENPPDRNPGEMSCQERAKIDGGEQTIAANAAVAAYCTAKMHLILSDKDIEPTSEIFFDLEVGLAQAYNRSVNYQEEPLLEGV